MNPNEVSPLEPHCKNDDETLQQNHSQNHQSNAPPSEIPNFSDPNPSPLALPPRNSSHKGGTVSIQTFEGDEFLISHSVLAGDGHIICSSPFASPGSSDSATFTPGGSQPCHHSIPVSGASGAHNSSEVKPLDTFGVRVSTDRIHFSPLQSSPVAGASSAGGTVKLLDPLDADLGYENSGCRYENSGCPLLLEGPTVRIRDLRFLLVDQAERVCGDAATAEWWFDTVLKSEVSTSGNPLQRLGAYLLLGLRARLISSRCRTPIHKALRCEECPIYKTLGYEKTTGERLYFFREMFSQILPYQKFAHESANEVIKMVMENEPRIHIIDFQLAQGFQWMALMLALKSRPGGPPSIRLTAFDDKPSILARVGGFAEVAKSLTDFAQRHEVPFQFSPPIRYTRQIVPEDLLQPGEAVAVTCPYVLHQVGDYSLSSENPRSRLLAFVRGLSPKVVTFAEMELDTSTSSFVSRFLDIMNYYNVVFDSIDVASPRARDDVERIGMERHCIAEDMIDMIACEGPQRLRKYELLAGWRSRFAMAGFTASPLHPSVALSVRAMLKEYNPNFKYKEKDGALYLAWEESALATFSAFEPTKDH